MDLKTSFDTDALLYGILSRSPLKAALSGGIYVGDDRPDDSTAEDVVINTLALTQEYHPQRGVSNVNVYVSDKAVRVGGAEQFVADRVRLRVLTDMAVGELRAAHVTGLALTMESQTVLKAEGVRQHFTNIRVSWNIQG